MDAALRACPDLPERYGQVAITGEFALRGVSNGGRVSGRLLVSADLSPGSIRLEPVEAPPAFVFIATGLHRAQGNRDDQIASLTLRQSDGTAVQERSRELLEPLLGVPLSAHELIWVLIGCVSINGSMDGRNLGPNAMRGTFGGALPAEIFFRRNRAGAPWNLVAMGGTIPGRTYQWRVDYSSRFQQVVRQFRIRSQEWNGLRGRTFDVSFTWRRVDVGVFLDDQLFATSGPSPQSGS